MNEPGLPMFYTSEPEALLAAMRDRPLAAVPETGAGSRLLKCPQLAETPPPARGKATARSRAAALA